MYTTILSFVIGLLTSTQVQSRASNNSELNTQKYYNYLKTCFPTDDNSYSVQIINWWQYNNNHPPWRVKPKSELATCMSYVTYKENKENIDYE